MSLPGIDTPKLSFPFGSRYRGIFDGEIFNSSRGSREFSTDNFVVRAVHRYVTLGLTQRVFLLRSLKSSLKFYLFDVT